MLEYEYNLQYLFRYFCIYSIFFEYLLNDLQQLKFNLIKHSHVYRTIYINRLP